MKESWGTLENQEQEVPLVVERGPPGCNASYSIASILHGESFLANYPHPVTLRHQHGKLIKPTLITLHRPLLKKNVNYILNGSIWLETADGVRQGPFPYLFGAESPQAQVSIETDTYYSGVVIVPVFTTHKKLPFEFGKISMRGEAVSYSDYAKHQRFQAIKVLKEHLQKSIIGSI